MVKKGWLIIMDAQTIQTVISTLGFPIVMCGVLVWYIRYLSDFNNNVTNTILKSIEDLLKEQKSTLDRIELMFDRANEHSDKDNN